MALKDLKSDLSKFRMPKKDPLENKKIDEVNKKSNQTPLSSMIDSAPKIPRSQTTTNKEGVEPRKFDNSSNFLGETTPPKVDNSSKFLGETTPQKVDNSSKFLGETTPSKMDNSENFLGETNPNKFDNSENFLGETTPTPANNESRFLGEANPNKFDNSSNFLGETTPSSADNTEQFLGETTPTPTNTQSQFLGETTKDKITQGDKEKGETTPAEFDRSSKFLGETTPLPSDKESRFLGETTKDKITQGDKEKGETTPTEFTFNPNHSDRGVTPTDVNNFQDIHAIGFNSKFGGVEATKFIGVNPNNTVFDGTTSLYSNINDSTFTLGRTYEQSFNSSGRLNSGQTGFGIGKSQAQRKSPSFLDLQYNKFNLKDDSFNTGLGLFRHPLILRGIQRKGISKGEPQNWGVGGLSFDDGLIRGGVVTSTTRALIDVARIGSWFASVEGVLWGVKQFGMQRTNTFGKIWTPLNMLAAIGGQHIGLKPMRPGLIPLNDPTVKYGTVLKGYEVADNAGFFAKKAAALITQYDTLDLVYSKIGIFENGLSTVLKSDERGGFNSTYGINLSGPSNHTRYVNTFVNASKDKSHTNPKTNFNQTYEPLNPNAWNSTITPDKFNTYADDLPQNTDEAKNFGVVGRVNGTYNAGINVADTDSNTIPPILRYNTLSYGSIPNRKPSDTSFPTDIGRDGYSGDFRSLLKGDSKVRSENENYAKNNIDTRVGLGASGRISDTEKRTEWWDTKKRGDRYDKVNASNLDEEKNDLVHLWFKADGGSKVQFRGTVKGITETFSPSWESIKYNGRADQAYKYTTFERSLSFNFQVYATSRIEMKPIWTKLNYLSTMTMPQYGGDAGYQGTLVYFRLGNLYDNKLAFIESLSYNMSDETPWDVSLLGSPESIGELPMGVDVSIGLKILGDVRPEIGKKVYDWSF